MVRFYENGKGRSTIILEIGTMIPDYLICIECETPCYTFEWSDAGAVTEALCSTCGADDITQFVTEEEYEEMAMDRRFWPDKKV